MSTNRILACVLAAGLSAPAARAVVWTVDDAGPADFSSIQGAINAASNGDEIVVRPGRYKETLNFLGKSLTVRSEAGPSATTVYLEGETRVVLLNGNSTLRGFTIAGGRARTGGGILVSGGVQPVIEANVIRDNVAARDGSAFPAFGGGIAVEASASPVITRNVLAGNLAEGDGQGLLAYGGAIDVADDATAVVTDNTIAQNRATDSGGGISVGVAGILSPVDLTHNTLVSNEAGSGSPNAFSYGGGITVGDGAVAAIRNNLFAQNLARFSGGGIQFFATGLQGIVYARNDFDGNLPAACGGLPSSKCNGDQLFVPALFRNAAVSDYRLRSDSAVIDQGTASGIPATDADGRPRAADGDLDGTAAPDVGAFENQREATRLRFDTRDALAWDDSVNAAVTFELYRDDLAAAGAATVGQCLAGSLPTPSTTDAAVPAPGAGFLYLVRGRGAVPGSLGTRSSGSERVPTTPCP